MKFLISGLGSIGRRHFRNLLALGERDIILHRTHRATLPDDELAGFPVETDLTKALAQRPDALIVTNPTALHLQVAIPAAEAGCHILMEKPISHSLEGVNRLEAALLRGGGQCLVGFQFRYHPGLRRVKSWVEEGIIGTPLSARAHWGEYLPGWHPWEDYTQGYAARPELGGGVVLTLSHPLDYLRWLSGEVSELWAFTGNQGLGMAVEDTAEIGLRFETGCLGSLHLDYNQRPPSHTLDLTGARGRILWDNADGTARLYQAEGAKEWQIITPPEGFERNWLFMDELRHFLAVIRGEAQPLCTLEDGIQALRLSLGALDSAGMGIRVNLTR
jgi:predicted dehydrogenase